MKKTISFAVIHFTIATIVAYILTGSFLLGSLIAMIEPSVNTCAFHLHELVWKKSKFLARTTQRNPLIKTMSFACIHFSVAFTVVYLLTGNAFIGGIMALIEPSINSVAYYFHEKVWQTKIETEYASSASKA